MIKLRIDKSDVDRVINKLAQLDPKRKDGIAKRAMVDASAFIMQVLVWNVSGIILKRRTGYLARSIGFTINDTGNQLKGIIGSGQGKKYARVKYADILETGGVITPKNVHWLTIPTRLNQTPSGVTRFTAPQLYEKYGKKNIVYIDNTMFIKTGKKGNLKGMFNLVKRATIPSFRYMARTAESCQSRIADIMINRIDKEINQ